MSEPDDARLGAEFEAYRARLLATVDPAGPLAVRSTVRRRHRRRVATVAVVTVAAVALPVAGFAALARDDRPPPTPAQTSEPAPAPTAPPSQATPGPSVTPGASPTVPDGRLTRAQLLSASLDLPAWVPGPACPAADVRLVTDGDAPGTVRLDRLDHGDVDRDGTAETVALLRCVQPYGGPGQVVAFDRDAQGRIVTLARVMHTDVDTPEVLDTLDVTDDGTVRVRIADRRPDAPGPRRTLWRTYRFDGDRFVHTAGPTAWPVAPTASSRPTATPPSRPALTVTATDLVYAPATDYDFHRGTTTITIVNTGTRTIEYPMVTFPASSTDHPEHAAWRDCPTGVGGSGRITCVTRPLAPGERRQMVFPFITTDLGPDREVVVLAEVGRGDAGATPVSGSTVRTTFTASFAD